MLSKDKPIIIAGPCSAENEEIVFSTAKELCAIGVNSFRAGLWKPRTHPNAFEGVGELGFPWLQRVQRELGMKVSVEVACAKHVDLALKAGVDMLWIGARTSTNPFSVQEIADTLKGVDIPVFIKNPINPELELWIGAIERVANAGVKQIAAIHRGFSTYQKHKYRNTPYWQLVVELTRRMPDLPIICDPSHIAGDRKYIEEIAQSALNMGFDGLMIESHIDPSCAKSDAAQQLKPSELSLLLDSLKYCKPAAESVDVQSKLEDLRLKIDELDSELIQALASRMSVVDKIGEIKKTENIAIFQPKRMEQILSNAIEKGIAHGLSSEYIEKLFQLIHEESINKQMGKN